MELVKIMFYVVPILIIAAAGGIFYYLFLKIRYRTAKSNEALIITGPNLGDPEKETNIFTDDEGRSMKIIRGGGHRLKLFQTSTPVNLTSFQLKFSTPRVFTNGGVPIVAEAVAMIKVADELKGIANYAEQFLGKEQDEIEREITEVLSSNLRAILSKMTVEEINNDREQFNADVAEVAQKQLELMGFKITSLGLQDLRDADKENGYLENLGRPRIAEVRKLAEIAEADSERETRMHKARTEQETQEEELKRQTEIAESQKLKDLREAANKEETERARAKSEQSYELEKTKLSKEIQEEQLKLLAYKKEEELRIAQIEKERQVKLEEEEAKVRKAKADADFYETTKMAEAEARKSEIDGTAQAKIKEEQGLAEAKVKRETGLAEAEVILKRGQAEAESKRLLAEAIAKHGEVVIIEKMIEMLPVYAEKIAQPLSNIESIKIIDSGNGNGLNSLGNSVAQTMVGIQEPLKELTGIDINKMLTDLVNRGNTHTVVRTDTVNSKEDTEKILVETEEVNEVNSDESVSE